FGWDAVIEAAIPVIGGDCLPGRILVIGVGVGQGRRHVGMRKEVREGSYLRACRRRIEEPSRDQVIEGDRILGVWVVKLPRRLGTDSTHGIEGARIGRAGTVFSKVARSFVVAGNDCKVVWSRQRVRVALVVDEEKSAVFQIEKFWDVDGASQATPELVKTIC